MAADVDDWSPLIDAAFRHGIGSLLCDRLVSLGGDCVADDLKVAAAQHLNWRRDANHSGLQQLYGVLDALRGAGIRALPFKGPTLSEAYGNIAHRDFRDLDVLVHEPDFARTLVVLEDLGYELPTRHLAPYQLQSYHRRVRQDALFPTAGLTVEPHCGLAQLSFGLDLPVPELFARASEQPLGGRFFAQMSAEDTFLTLALHGGKERWKRLIWLSDVAHFVQAKPDLDWDEIEARARAHGLTTSINLAINLAMKLLSVSFPVEAVRRAVGDRRALQLCRTVQETIEHFEVSVQRREWFEVKKFHWSLLARPRERLSFLSGLINDVRLEDYEAANLSPRLSWLYPAIKAWRRISGQAARDRSLN